MNLHQTLLMACEARDIGRPVEAAQLFAEAAPDFEYVRKGPCSKVLKFHLDEGPDEYDDEDWVPLAADQQRRAWLQQFRAIDWFAWRGRATVNRSVLDDALRAHYSPERLTALAQRSTWLSWIGQPPTYLESRARGLDDSNPFVATPKPDTDGIEVRVSSWANVIRPLHYGVFRDDGDS